MVQVVEGAYRVEGDIQGRVFWFSDSTLCFLRLDLYSSTSSMPQGNSVFRLVAKSHPRMGLNDKPCGHSRDSVHATQEQVRRLVIVKEQ